MPTERLSERDLDRILGRSLRSFSQPVPADFTARILARARESQERRILARVVLQQRLALAGCIGLVAVAVLAPMLLTDSIAGVLQGNAAGFAEQCRTFLDKLPTAVEAVWGQWQRYTVLGAVFGFAAYCLASLFLRDRSKPLLILDW